MHALVKPAVIVKVTLTLKLFITLIKYILTTETKVNQRQGY